MLRVLARSAAIQLEEVAAVNAFNQASRKGKARAAGERVGPESATTSDPLQSVDTPVESSVGSTPIEQLSATVRDPGTIQGSPRVEKVEFKAPQAKLLDRILVPNTVEGSLPPHTPTVASTKSAVEVSRPVADPPTAPKIDVPPPIASTSTTNATEEPPLRGTAGPAEAALPLDDVPLSDTEIKALAEETEEEVRAVLSSRSS